MTTLAFFVITTQESGLAGAMAHRVDHADVMNREPHVVLLRRKREWQWNALYVEEERPAPEAYKIGKLKSSKKEQSMKFEIEGEGANSIFTVDRDGNLYVTTSLDREKKASYNLTARMYDEYNRLVEDAGDFVIHVTDINDNKPVFAQTYNGYIMERSKIGTFVTKVTASDADDPSSANGIVGYSFAKGGDVSAFSISETTGEISCRVNTLDRESRSQYVMVVKAQDLRGEEGGRTATTSVTITITDANDNMPSFSKLRYEMRVPENHKLNEVIDTLVVTDRDELKNKKPKFRILKEEFNQVFDIQLDSNKNGNLMLKQALDYEKTRSYTFTVQVKEDLDFPADNLNTAVTSAQVTVEVMDVDEPPVFSESVYTFEVLEEHIRDNIGIINASDPDRANKSIRYSIEEEGCPISIHPISGQLSTVRKLDRELQASHIFFVKAQEEPDGLESVVKVHITVQDYNDHDPELDDVDAFVCENDSTNTVIATLKAKDEDDQPATFKFSLARPSSNFSIKDLGNSSAVVLVTQGPFSADDPKEYSVDVRISDGGQPVKTSVTKLAIKSCRCDAGRISKYCKPGARRMGVSFHALIAILLCIITILVIVILFAVRKRYQKDSLASMKNSGEIHEQLVTYDEEGGGEMDTNGYDVSILSSACQDGSLLRHSDHHAHPSLYAMVQKPHHNPQPPACKGDMAAMIEVKKDEADHDRDGFPYDTLHIYGYEGPESLAGSLSSLESSSSGSNLDYDFLNDWGPRFKALAELYGVDSADYYHQY
ncbi:Cadherin-5 [Oryzias melastigma]|uniref:Cadherin-5 n=1 Tax=Oryzias melastigma TaxID=30732 RepID=A0A834FNG3_ORYME|nr:Cadherin-5 [Oryzias melastigma]